MWQLVPEIWWHNQEKLHLTAIPLASDGGSILRKALSEDCKDCSGIYGVGVVLLVLEVS